MSKPRPLNKFGPWLLKGLAAAAFLTASVAKLSGAPMMVHEFNVIGFGQGFRIVTGLIELSGVALLLIPQTTRIGASVLFAVCAGALGAQTLKLHGNLIHVFVLMALTGFLAWRGGLAEQKLTPRAARATPDGLEVRGKEPSHFGRTLEAALAVAIGSRSGRPGR